jgi:hypothetical protein
MRILLVLGATGVMGRRIVALARRLLPGVRVLRASRRPRHDTRSVDIHDLGSLRGALRDVSAVINAVGPFEYDPEPLLAACAEAGCDYVDIAETPLFIGWVEELARGPIRVVSGCSTVPGLVEVLAQHWAGRDEVSRVRVFLGMGSRNPASAALLYSLVRPLGRKAPDGGHYFDGLVRKRLRGLPPRLYGRYPSAFDRHGLRLGTRTVPAAFHAGMDREWLSRALWCAARVAPALSDARLSVLCRLAQPAMPLVGVLGTPVGVLSVEALDGQGRVVDEIEVRARRNGLNVPSLPAVWAVRRLLAPEPLPHAGALRLAELLSPGQVVDGLRAEGYDVSGVGTAVYRLSPQRPGTLASPRRRG